jgi:hypothetical protein
MLVLFDQGVPVPLRQLLIAHDVRTAFEMGWHTLTNGDLLRAAETAGFAVMLTNDKRLIYQQNLAQRSIAIVVLGRNRWSCVKQVIPAVVAAVDASTPGSYVVVDVPA